jgi:hypothetical protein
MYSTKQVTPLFAMGVNQSGSTYNAKEQTMRTYTPITTEKHPEDLVSPFKHKKTPIIFGAVNN